ncbi:hypothetical protein AKO1_009774 [Acrasis kona]|uniref:Serine aminopeptidase S33 domain-containing protein n=1 Tax=Acrasis kona TaxID=1008807 RepID=A0AAW2ZQE4_9EUKA
MNALRISNLSHLWDDVCNLIIRPQRCVYEPSVALGPRLFTLGNKIFERKDFDISNKRGLKLQCSHYQPIETQRAAEKLPCVIYCHGNCGSRCDALDAVQVLLPYNITVLAFDFSGSGMSEGDYVSLGFFEQQDVHAVVEYLWASKRVSRVGLWGRSMGAATSIMYSSMDTSIAGIVVDSPFVSLEELIQELVLSNQAWVPRKLIKVGVGVMKRSIQSRAGFNIRENCPIEKASKCFVPCLFAHAEGDDFIRIHHSEKLYEAYSGDKNLIRFEGDHNSERPDFFYDSVCIFFYNTLISNDPNLDNVQSQPKGSVAHTMGVGVETAKGKAMAEEDSSSGVSEPEGEELVIDPTTSKGRKQRELLGVGVDESIGTLPQSPHSEQMHIPSHNSLVDHHDPEEQKLEEEYLMRALIESVKDEMKVCKEDESEVLRNRLQELKQQALSQGIILQDEKDGIYPHF